MLKLYGFGRSNYYNTAKMALLEKGVDFEEVKVFPSQEDEYLDRSPMGKVPCLETAHGSLSETTAIIDYVDESFEGPSLFPGDAWQRAQARELMKQVELYLDLAVRPCFGEVFFGGTVSDEVKTTAQKSLAKGLRAIARRAQWKPYIAGESFSAADALTYFSLPLAIAVAQKLWGEDPAESLPGVAGMLEQVAQRPSAQRIAADQKS